MRLRRLLAYAAVYFLWGATYLAVRTVVLVTPPFSAAALRFLLSGLLLLVLSRMQGAAWPSPAEWTHSAKLGFAMFAINYACFFWAEQRIYSGVASVVVASMPVWILLAERLFNRTRSLSPATLAGLVLGILGVVLVTRSEPSAAASHGHSLVAIGVLLAGTICWSFGSVWSRSLTLPSHQGMRAALQMTLGGLMLALLAAVTGEPRHLPAALAAWTLTTWLCFAYLVAASIVAFTAYVWLLHHEPASRVATYAYVNPLVALALGLGVGHERIGPWQILGGALVLLGVFCTLRGRPVPARGLPPAHTQTKSESP